MTRLLCRLGWDGTIPNSAAASALDIHAWLVPARVDPSGSVSLAVELEALLNEHPTLAFSLEWHLRDPLSPRQEARAIESLRPWLMHPRALRIGTRVLLWIHDPEQLSHPHFAARRLRQALGDEALLLAAGPPCPPSFEAGYERSDRIPVQQLRNGQGNYASLLAHAHYRPVGDWRLTVPCVRHSSEPPMAHQSAANTAEWLAQNQAWMALSRPNPEEQLVLLEQWPGESVAIPKAEPVTAQAIPPALPPATERAWGLMVAEHPAVLVHGFHLDLLARILAPLPRDAVDLYVSTPLEKLEHAEAVLKSQGWQRIRLIGVPNHGRDIAPFLLELLPRALAHHHPWILKLHTKRSENKPGGQRWGEALVQSLTNPNALAQLQELMQPNRNVCLAAPVGSFLPCTVCLGGNDRPLNALLEQAGLAPRWWLAQQFVAGSMWAAPSARLGRLLEIPLTLEAFEPEAGQTDGTLAHAWERMLPAILFDHEGERVVTLPAAPEAEQAFGHRWALAAQAIGTS